GGSAPREQAGRERASAEAEEALRGQHEFLREPRRGARGQLQPMVASGRQRVLLALHRTPRKTSRMHLFIRHLSLADLAVALFQVLPQLCWDITYRFRGPDGLCRVTLQQPARRSRLMIAAAWVLSFVLSTPQYFVFSVVEVSNVTKAYDCWANFIQPWGLPAYVTWMTGSIFVAPVPLKYCQSNKKFSLFVALTGFRHNYEKILHLCTESENPATTITALLASLNSCCNPWIYMFFSGHLLQDCIQSFPCCQNMKKTFNKEDSDSTNRKQTSFTNNRSPTYRTGAWKDSAKSSKSIQFIPVSS
ncbi:hypothetical protein E2I00_006825, partial [Balaenoptera physalus]